jgi:hypothetical protein
MKYRTAWLGILTLLGSAAGIGIICLAVRETRSNSNAYILPTEVSLVELTPNGARGNVHITLDELVIRDRYFAVTDRGLWEAVYFVAVPSDQSKKLDRTIFIRSNRVKNSEDAARFTSQTKITGIVTGETLEDSYVNELEKVDPELRHRDWIVVEEGRGITTTSELCALYGFGALLLLAAIGQFVWCLKRERPIRTSPLREGVTNS